MMGIMRKWIPDLLAWSVVLIVCSIIGIRLFAASNAPSGDRGFSEGPELLAILVTSSTCSAASDEAFHETFERAIHKLRSYASVHEKHLATLGVAVDWDIDQGLQALRKLGRFDEIAAGRKWLNSTALRLIAPTVGGTPVIPQFIVVSRQVVQDSGQVGTTADSVILRLIGPDAIVAWEREGALLRWP